MRLLALTAVAAVALLAAPPAAADHPGSNQGLARFGPLGLDQLVHRLPDVQEAFAAWEAQWPALAERFTIGTTATGFPLEGIRITDESVLFDGAATATGQKLRVYLDGGHHGNEYLGVELLMYYARDLLELAGGDDATQAYLRETEVYLVPIVNPDGNYLDTRKNANQVDVNRNYDFQWGGPGSGDTVADQTYRGPSPASEAEVKANMAFGAKILPDVWVTAHTGVAEFYWPWGWSNDKAPDAAFFESIEKPFEEATHGRVDAMQAAELYLAAGATDDWAYGVLGVPGHTFEVHEDQFIPVYGEPIPAVIADQLAGLDWVVRNVKHWGAWLEATPADGGGILVKNHGWAVARNATVGATVLADIPPGGELLVDPDGASTLRYKPLLIETSKERVVALPNELGPSQEGSEPASAVPVVLVLLASLAVAARRRI
ncbi:MAG: carboxypeptidase [Thermoplasmata archaeon]|jgi:hypothetical protein|nr:carboxypeptidase [Thermoplasmata archaeon]